MFRIRWLYLLPKFSIDVMIILSNFTSSYHAGPILSLRHHKSDVDEVGSGKECGIIFKDESILPEVGDVIQCVRDILFVSDEIPWNPPGF